MNPQTGKLDRRNFLSALSGAVGVLAINRPALGSAMRVNALQRFVQLAPKPVLGPHTNLYQIHQLSQRELLQMYADLLKDACIYAASDWKISVFDSTAGYWGDGVSNGNGGIRTIVSTLLASATLLRYEDSLDSDQRRDLSEKSLGAIRYTTATHRTGTQACADGKPWGATAEFGGESWQSGMWTGTLAWGAWLIWNRLDPALQRSLQQVVAWECDILSHRPPPNGLWLDTKAEENGWEVPCLVLGELMFPSHPNAAAWHETALKYMMNTLCTEADTDDTALVDGRPMNKWVTGANLQPDFTLENHHIFHPSYVGCSCYFLTQAVMYYTYGGKTVPQAATHHLMDTWRMFQTILLPWGEAAYPQGMDWELHGLPFINLYASLATHWRDSLAAHLEERSLQYLRAWQRMGHGSLSIPGSRFGITRHAINAEQAAYGFLAHKIFGPAAAEITAQAAAAREEGTRDYPYVDFIAHRTLTKFVSFSWKNRIMGLLIPIGDGHDGNPDFTVPIQDGFVGSFELDPPGDVKTDKKIALVKHERHKAADGFETTGTLLLNGGRLQQELRMISLGSQTVIYEDRVTALSDVTVRTERGVPVGIENDEITGGSRLVFNQDGQTIFDWKNPRRLAYLSGSWVNIDGRLGVVVLASAAIAYVQGTAYLPGISVYSDILYGSYSDHAREFKAGEEVAHRLAIFFVELTPQDTEALARQSTLEMKNGRQRLRFTQPGGKKVELLLLSDRLEPERER